MIDRVSTRIYQEHSEGVDIDLIQIVGLERQVNHHILGMIGATRCSSW
jgi:hypothetical protein